MVPYNHPGNQLATLVGLNSNTSQAEEAGKQVAMQVAAMNPVAIDKSGIDQATIDKELEVGKDLAIQEGKPAELADKIAFGGGHPYAASGTLTEDFITITKLFKQVK